MTTATKTPTKTLPAVAERERLRGIAAGHAAHRDRIDEAIDRAKKRTHALHSEIAEAQLAKFNGDAEAEKLVKKLRAERAAIRDLYREDRSGPGVIASGDLVEERDTLRLAVRQTAEALKQLHIDRVEEFVANAAPMVAEAEAAIAKAREAVQVARAKWDEARGELNAISRDAGLGETPEFPLSDKGITTMRPHHIPAEDLAHADLAVFTHSPGGRMETVLIDSPAFEELERASAWTRVR